MIAQKSADFPIFRGHARQRGRGFGALAQTHGRTAIPFIKKYIVPAAKIIGAGKLLVDVKNSKHLQKMWEQKQFGNNWEVEKRNLSVKQLEPDPFLEKADRKTVALAKTFLTI